MATHPAAGADGSFSICGVDKWGNDPADAKKNELKPWQEKGWVIPKAGAEFVCPMEEVLDAYERPYNKDYPLVGLDETRKQLVSETISSFTDEHGVRHVEYEYKREGVADIYMVTAPLAGRREVLIKDDHSAKSWAQVITFIAEEM